MPNTFTALQVLVRLTYPAPPRYRPPQHLLTTGAFCPSSSGFAVPWRRSHTVRPSRHTARPLGSMSSLCGRDSLLLTAETDPWCRCAFDMQVPPAGLTSGRTKSTQGVFSQICLCDRCDKGSATLSSMPVFPFAPACGSLTAGGAKCVSMGSFSGHVSGGGVCSGLCPFPSCVDCHLIHALCVFMHSWEKAFN